MEQKLINTVINAVDESGTVIAKQIKGVKIDGDYLALAQVLYATNGGAITTLFPSVDGQVPTNPLSISTVNFPYLYNGYTNRFNRQKSNEALFVLASAARTVSVNSLDLINYNARGAHIIINVTAYPAAASVVPTIQGYDEISAQYYDILIGNAITATGYTVLKVYPGIGEIANGAASDILPNKWRVSMAHADADSITYSVGAQMVL